MADEDFAGDDDPSFFFDDDDYLYVEDEYAIADELAETQVPSPGYTGVNDEIALESWEYDVFEYFGELEYGSDSYWDARIRHLKDSQGQADEKNGGKRKSEEDAEAGLARKRRKENDVVDNVIYMPFDARITPLPPKVSDGCRFALLPDWKERFPENGGEFSPSGKGKQMPADMRRAAEGGDEEDEEDEEDQGPQEEGEEMEVDPDDEQGAEGLDQDVVMQVLRQKLADSGLGDVDEAVFKDAIAQMLAGGGDGDDAVGGLASLLLGQKGRGGDAFQGFLAGQGVQLEGEGDDQDEENEDNNEDDDDSQPATTSTTASRPTRSPGFARSTASSSNKSRAPPPRHPQTRSPAAASKANHPTVPNSAPAPPASTARPTRKRRAPSLEEPSIPQPSDPNETAKPTAKRRRTPGPEAAADEAVTPPAVPVAGKRTTRSAAAAAGKRGR